MTDNSAIAQYIAKLERRGRLPDDDREKLLRIPGVVKEHAAGDVIIANNVPSEHCVVVQSGFVSRVRTLHRGARQIVAFHLPGDAVDLQNLLFTRTDHQIQAHAPTRTFWIAHKDLWSLTDQCQVLAKALWLDTLVDASIFREWTANIGQRRAPARIAHLFLELAARFAAIGMVRNRTFSCPLTQTAFSEALGLSLVHFNKSLQTLKRAGFISTKHSITIEKPDDLVAMSGFDPTYLHLDASRVVDLVEAADA